ncbi:hypothetical protein LCGC14_0630520 [marine sediment metagenome]|uniref:Uncharacterized protein n=1 Tax=marine sediment metagenome TaxID=412755 RepID=A0A0F9UAM0_9ZZZZ
MNLIHNRIINPSGDGPSFEDWVNKILKNAEAEGNTKVASEEAKPGTGIDTDNEPRGQMRGQVINTEGEEDMTNDPQCPDQGGNSRPDTGGTTDTKTHEQSDKEGGNDGEVKEATCGKEMGESDDAGKVTEDHTDAGPGDDQNPEPKILINNDPNYQKGESTSPGKVTGKNKKTEASLKSRFEKISTLDRLSKLTLFASLSSNKEYPIQYVEAMVGLKVANLTEEEKAWFSDFWKTMYPPEYVAEMVADR